jgi:HSP20 family protein
MAGRRGRPAEGGGFGLGGLLSGLGNLIELVSEMAEEGKAEVTRTGEIRGKGGLKDVRGVYGFTVRVGLGGEPTVETFGNIKKTKEGPVVEEMREPLVDVFDEQETIRVIAELPGVEPADIRVELRDDILTVTAEGKERKYTKEILLPAKGKADSLKTSHRNGILEVVLEKAGKGA